MVIFIHPNTLAGTLLRGAPGALKYVLTLYLQDKETLRQCYDTWSSEEGNEALEALISTLTDANKSTYTVAMFE